MEVENTWKGHTFTLIVFAGIVVLSSIFFILGMLVGRAQGQKAAAAAAGAASSRIEAQAAVKEEPATHLTFYDNVKRNEPEAGASFPSRPEPPPVESTPERKPDLAAAPRVSAGAAPVYQIGALKKAADAEKLVREVRRKGIKAFVVPPLADEANPFFRVQVGPLQDGSEARDIKKKLEAAGYHPILKK